ncbi:MAG: beta-ketoacyl-[acyl-carrier-protein] synthase family protein [Candidatus Omnitrophota bacterium]
MAKKRSVITGIGVVSSVGIGKEQFWTSILKGVSGINKISLFKPFDRDYKFAGEIRGVDFASFLGEKGLKRLDRSTKFLLIASKLAMADAQIYPGQKDDASTGVVVGTDWGNIESNCHFHNLVLTKGPNEVNPMDFPSTITNSAASQISMRYGLTGLNTTISRGFVSAVDSLGYAKNAIQNYGLKRVLSGAVENLSIEFYSVFHKRKWLRKTRNILDKSESGVVLGEGACVLVLEDIKSALRRNINIFAEVAGYGFSFGDNPASLKKSISLALDDAGLSPQDIDYISANANGHKRKDSEEAKAIAEIFGGNKQFPIISTIKPYIGECFGATGAMQAAACCLSLSKGLIPPVFLSKTKNKGKVSRSPSFKGIKKKISIAMINSFSLDGNNACLILKRPD